MKIGEFLKTAKGKVTMIGGTTVVAVGIIVAVLLQGGGYRSILVKQVEGTVNIVGEKNNGEAYSGERLYSGDDVTVLEASSLTMCMDNDKYVYADANTHFKLEASPAKEDSRIRIILDKGSELNELKSKLGSNDSYEVDTPNSTMSVRGTVFRVTVYVGSDGLVYTLLEVKEGLVFVRLKTQDGTFNGVEREFKAGESALIRGNFEFSEFIENDEGEVERHLDYESLPEDSVERLITLLKNELDIDEESDNLDGNIESKDDKSEKDDKGKKVDSEGNPVDEKVDDKSEADNKSDKDKKTEANTSSEQKTEKKADSKKSTDNKKNTSQKKKDNTDAVTENTAQKDKTQDTNNTAQTKTADEKKTEQSQPSAEKKTEEKTEHVHTLGAWETVTEATCTSNGSRQRRCTSCGEVVDKESIAATGHSWGAWTTVANATCTSAGSNKRTCTSCGESETSRVEALGHDWVTHKSESTGADGYFITWEECSRCGLTK